jgi:hypothetical protein
MADALAAQDERTSSVAAVIVARRWRDEAGAAEQPSPRQVSSPSLTATPEITCAAIGSSHHQPNRRCRPGQEHGAHQIGADEPGARRRKIGALLLPQADGEVRAQPSHAAEARPRQQ